MDDANELTIRAALTDQLKRCEARCAGLAAELESVTAAMKQSDAANVELAAKLEAARAEVAAERERLAKLCEREGMWDGQHFADLVRRSGA